MTLAQKWLDSHKITEYDPWFYQRLRYRELDPEYVKKIAEQPGIKFLNDFSGSNGLSIEDIGTNADDLVAERFVFDDDLLKLRASWLESGQITNNLILSTARIPYHSVWVEWPHNGFNNEHVGRRCGVLLDRVVVSEKPGDIKIAVGCVMASENHQGVIFAGNLDNVPAKDAELTTMALLWHDADIKLPKSMLDNSYSSFMLDALFGLLLIQQPRVVTTSRVKYEPKLQKARAKKGKPPLPDFNRVTVHIGRTQAKHHADYMRGPQEGEIVKHSRRKLHHVDPHWKSVPLKDGTYRALFIEGYWRGDPALGISTRQVKIKIDK